MLVLKFTIHDCPEYHQNALTKQYYTTDNLQSLINQEYNISLQANEDNTAFTDSYFYKMGRIQVVYTLKLLDAVHI